MGLRRSCDDRLQARDAVQDILRQPVAQPAPGFRQLIARVAELLRLCFPGASQPQVVWQLLGGGQLGSAGREPVVVRPAHLLQVGQVGLDALASGVKRLCLTPGGQRFDGAEGVTESRSRKHRIGQEEESAVAQRVQPGARRRELVARHTGDLGGAPRTLQRGCARVEGCRVSRAKSKETDGSEGRDGN